MPKSLKLMLAVILLFILSACANHTDLPYEMTAQTEHFNIYCSPEDTQAFEKLANELEQYCRRIEASLNIDKPQKIKLAVYPSPEDFKKALGLPSESKSLLYGGNGQISTVSPHAENMYPADRYQTSGILPYVIIESAFNAPEYLTVGASLIEGGSGFNSQAVVKLAEEGLCDIQALKKMNDDELSTDQNSMLCAYTLSDYIQTEFGKEAYIKLLKKPNIKSVLKISEAELKEGCIDYIKKTYATIPFDLQKETEHFKFYCETDHLSVIEDTITTLEENYERVVSDLRVNLNSKTDVVFYPTEEWFFKAAKGTNSNVVDEDLYGFWYNGIIHLLSPSILTVRSNDIPSTALHEFIHAVTFELNPDPEKAGYINTKMPRYLIEGIATYESNQMSYNFMEAGKAIRENKFPTIEELETLYSGDNIYTYGSLFCEYVVKQYGQDNMVEILKTLDIESALGKSKGDIYSEWIEYIKKQYNIN